MAGQNEDTTKISTYGGNMANQPGLSYTYTQSEVVALPGFSFIQCLQFSRDGNIIATSSGTRLAFVRSESGFVITILEGYSQLAALIWLTSNELVCAFRNGELTYIEIQDVSICRLVVISTLSYFAAGPHGHDRLQIRT